MASLKIQQLRSMHAQIWLPSGTLSYSFITETTINDHSTIRTQWTHHDFLKPWVLQDRNSTNVTTQWEKNIHHSKDEKTKTWSIVQSTKKIFFQQKIFFFLHFLRIIITIIIKNYFLHSCFSSPISSNIQFQKLFKIKNERRRKIKDKQQPRQPRLCVFTYA